MSHWKIFFCTVVCFSQLFLPCESGLLQKFFGNTLNLIESGANVFLKCPKASGGCPNSNITYFLYTQETQESPHQLDPTKPETIKNANFAKGAPLKVIFHGYTGHKSYSPNVELRPAFFKNGEYNIISVDWSPLGPDKCYLQSVDNVEAIVECAAQFVDTLLTEKSDLFNLDNTHILGYSLGAHIAGLTAASLNTGTVSRVTGFDPAGPLFDDLVRSRDNMLNPGVAKFVDVYHSNSAFKGKEEPLGHIDIYVNNGASQPGCSCNSTCEHVRAVDIFAEALNSAVGLWGFPCKSWKEYTKGSCKVNSTSELRNFAGDSILKQDHGVYWTLTHAQAPYLLAPDVYVKNSTYGKTVDVTCTYVDYLF